MTTAITKNKALFTGLLTGITALGASSHLSQAKAASSDPDKPNIILILADDLGWTDINCREDDGSPTPGGEFDSTYYKTPHIKALRQKSMRFTNACVYPFCAPTRASLLTGKYPARLHVTQLTQHMREFFPKERAMLKDSDGNITGYSVSGDSRFYLPLEEQTLAEILKENGYTTCSVGKWHLSPLGANYSLVDSDNYLPDKHGFGYNIGGASRAGLAHKRKGKNWDAYANLTKLDPKVSWLKKSSSRVMQCINSVYTSSPDSFFIPGKDDPHFDSNYITDLLTKRALQFIDMSMTAEKEKPFFLYLPHFAVHTIHEYKNNNSGKTRVERGVDPRGLHSDAVKSHIYGQEIACMDQSVGAIVKYLADNNLAEGKSLLDNTIVIFMSDNGGLRVLGETTYTTNYPLKLGKGFSDNGGVEVPFLIYWPGVTDAVQSENAISNEPIHAVDILPTICDIVGVEIPEGIDGVSFKDKIIKPDGTASQEDSKSVFGSVPNYIDMPVKAGESNVVCPSAYIQEDGYFLYKRYDKDSYIWPDDFDINRMQLKYDTGKESYELYDIEADYSWLSDGAGYVLKMKGDGQIIAAGAKGISGNISRKCSFNIIPESDNGCILGWGQDGAVTGLWKIILKDKKIVLQTGDNNFLSLSKALNTTGEICYSVNITYRSVGLLTCEVVEKISQKAVSKSRHDIVIDTCTGDDIQIAGWNGDECYSGIVSEISVSVLKDRICHYSFDTVGNTADGFCYYENDTNYPLLLDSVDMPFRHEQTGGVAGSGFCKFDGEEDFIQLPIVLDPSSGEFSVFISVKGGSIKTSSLICQQETYIAGETARSWLYVDDEGYFASALTGEILTSDQKLDVDSNLWHRVGVVWDGSVRKLYYDGVVIAEDDVSDNISVEPCSGGLLLGAHKSLVQGTFWDGYIDELSIYGNALQVGELAGAAVEDNLIYSEQYAYWTIDDGAGIYITDSSGNNRHGAIAGDIFQRNNLYDNPGISVKYAEMKEALTKWQQQTGAATIRPEAVNSVLNKAYGSIQDAISSARIGAGDIIRLYPCLHYFSGYKGPEDIDNNTAIIIDKPLSFEGIFPEDYASIQDTIISIKSTAGISIETDDVVIKGVTLTSFVKDSYALDGNGNGRLIIENCIISDGVNCIKDVKGLIMRNCLITDNSGIVFSNCHGVIENCTIVGNNTVCGASCELEFKNTIVWDNGKTGFGSNKGSYSNCCLTEKKSGMGNIVAEPVFSDKENGDYSLVSGSPCIDAGTELTGLPAYDLGGNDRVTPGLGDVDANAVLDIGAFEYQLK